MDLILGTSLAVILLCNAVYLLMAAFSKDDI